jgi:hypothetical protein
MQKGRLLLYGAGALFICSILLFVRIQSNTVPAHLRTGHYPEEWRSKENRAIMHARWLGFSACGYSTL